MPKVEAPGHPGHPPPLSDAVVKQPCMQMTVHQTIFLPNFLIFDKFSSLHNNVKLYKRDYSNFNPQDMINEFQSINWQNVFS